MPLPQIDSRELINLYHAGHYNRLSERFLAMIEFLHDNTYLRLNTEDQHALDVFASTFLYLFSRPDYVISDPFVVRFLAQQVTISNMLAMSSSETAEPCLRILEAQTQNFVKYLTLCSPRNTLRVDRQVLFATSPQLASMWYSYYAHFYPSVNVTERGINNLREHLNYDDSRINEYYGFQEPYFGSTYVDIDIDRRVRERINRWITSSTIARTLQINNRPNPRSIAILTAFWMPQHSSFRILSQFVDALSRDYELTLINLGPESTAPTDYFREVKRLDLPGNAAPDFQSVANNDYQVAMFLDVGMSPLSILMTNLRLAPIQICGLGQSVSTFGSQVDYFLSGTDVELVDEAARNYSERLVLLPGSGAIHNRPLYTSRGQRNPSDRFLINCSWYAQKTNPRMLRLLHRIAEKSRSGKRIVFRFFPGHSLARENHFLPFVRALDAAMGGLAEIIAAAPYDEYMARMEEGQFSIDCFPFGGCNTVADSLWVRRPMVTYEGTKWYNRIGSQMMRSVGLEELVVHTDDEYVDLVTRLVDDDAYRTDVCQRLNAVDLDKTIFNTDAKEHFLKAIAHLIAHHDELRGDPVKTPIYIR